MKQKQLLNESQQDTKKQHLQCESHIGWDMVWKRVHKFETSLTLQAGFRVELGQAQIEDSEPIREKDATIAVNLEGQVVSTSAPMPKLNDSVECLNNVAASKCAFGLTVIAVLLVSIHADLLVDHF